MAVVDADGVLVACGVVRDDDEIDDWLADHAPHPAVVAVDAPLLVPNATGMREAEKQIMRAFGRYKLGAHAANRSILHLDPPRGFLLAERHQWNLEVSAADGPVCLEVYPHALLIGWFGLAERLLYKKGPDRPLGFRRLAELLESIPSLQLQTSPRWAQLRSLIDRPARGDLTRIEDELDAIICAHAAWLWSHEPHSLMAYGVVGHGQIVAPPPPHHPPAPRAAR